MTNRIALVNNAGVAIFRPLEQTDFEAWRTSMSINLDGILLRTQAAILALKESRGAVVNIASTSGFRCGRDWPVSLAGIEGYF